MEKPLFRVKYSFVKDKSDKDCVEISREKFEEVMKYVSGRFSIRELTKDSGDGFGSYDGSDKRDIHFCYSREHYSSLVFLSTNLSSLVKLCTRDLDLPDAVLCRYGNSGDEPEFFTPELRRLLDEKVDHIVDCGFLGDEHLQRKLAEIKASAIRSKAPTPNYKFDTISPDHPNGVCGDKKE